MSINERKDKEFKVRSRRCNINDRISKRKKRTERGEATVNQTRLQNFPDMEKESSLQNEMPFILLNQTDE